MDEVPSSLKASYKIATLSEIQKCQHDDSLNVSSVLSLTSSESTLLLIHSNWDVQLSVEKWLTDSKRIRKELGLFENPATGSNSNRTCEKCFGVVDHDMGFQEFCCHKFCRKCWKDFIKASLKDHCLLLRCPVGNCDAAVNQDIVCNLASQENLRHYLAVFLRAYLDNNSKVAKGKWCTTPGCNHAVLPESGNSTPKFTCKCYFTFCYKCLKEAHQPVGCSIVETWRTEPLKQSELWRVAHTRNCPKCNTTIGVQDWFNHIQCTRCSFHFCRHCLASWFESGRWAGDSYSHVCSKEKLKEVAEVEEWAKATTAMSRYNEHIAHVKSHDKDQQQIITKLRTTQHSELADLAAKQGLSVEAVTFVSDAWLQVAECKRVFKWSSVYDYYFLLYPDSRKSLYNVLIKHGEYVIDQLCLIAGEIRKFVATNPPTGRQFDDFRQRLCYRTSVARNYFENMATAIQSAYPDMETLRWSICMRESIERRTEPATANANATDVGTSSGATVSADKSSEYPCAHCTFPNEDSTPVCVMCYH